MIDIPRLALSVRQPWAWAIIHAGKPVENRDWRKPNPGLKFRGRFAVHAAKGMTRDEYEDAAEFMAGIGVACPAPAELLRGGVIGAASVVDIVREHDSPWFFGPRALLLADAAPVTFRPASGSLGFFEWRPMDASEVPAPARWMLPSRPPVDPQGALL